MKRFILLIAMLSILLLIVNSCSKSVGSEKISIVCTIFPQYDWVRQILGEQVERFDITLLLDNKIDLHNYQPTVDDIVKITRSDLFIYVGGESDEWVEDVFPQIKKNDVHIINLLDVLGDYVKAEEIVEGMQAEDDYDDEDYEDDHQSHAHKHDDEDDDEGVGEIDEHIWLSLTNATICAEAIYQAIITIDPSNADIYFTNLTTFVGKLNEFEEKYRAITSAAPVKTLLFADRFPFRYLVDDFGISYYAAFPGCSAETEATFETIIFLARKVDELGLKNIMVTESSDQSIAKTIIANTNAKNQNILVMDAMQSVTSIDVQNGVTYLSIMENNLKVLSEALSR